MEKKRAIQEKCVQTKNGFLSVTCHLCIGVFSRHVFEGQKLRMAHQSVSASTKNDALLETHVPLPPHYIPYSKLKMFSDTNLVVTFSSMKIYETPCNVEFWKKYLADNKRYNQTNPTLVVLCVDQQDPVRNGLYEFTNDTFLRFSKAKPNSVLHGWAIPLGHNDYFYCSTPGCKSVCDRDPQQWHQSRMNMGVSNLMYEEVQMLRHQMNHMMTMVEALYFAPNGPAAAAALATATATQSRLQQTRKRTFTQSLDSDEEDAHAPASKRGGQSAPRGQNAPVPPMDKQYTMNPDTRIPATPFMSHAHDGCRHNVGYTHG
jgi:hypothetical protein